MTSSGTFSKLAIILTINLFVQMHIANAGSIPSLQSVEHRIKNILSNVCAAVDSVPELVCGNTIGFFEEKIEDEVSQIAETFCNTLASRINNGYPMNPFSQDLFQLFVGKHVESFQDICEIVVEKGLNELVNRMSNFLEKKCIAKLVEFLPVGENGKKPNLCAGLPSTVDDLCKRITNKGCQVIEAEMPLSLLIPDCEEDLSELVCDDLISVIENVVEESISLEPTAPKVAKIIETAIEDVVEEGKNVTVSKIATIIETAVEKIFEGDNEFEDRIQHINYNTQNNNNN